MGGGLYEFLVIHLGSRALDESFNERHYRYYPISTFALTIVILLAPSLVILDFYGRRLERMETGQ
jgi:hypothetical protein